MAPHATLLAAGAEVELVHVERDGDSYDPPDYLELNPMGVVPTLVEDDLVVTEAAAIVAYAVDSRPAAGLAPERGSRERARFDELLAFMSTMPQQAMLRVIYPERYTTASDPSGVREAETAAVDRHLNWLASVLAGQPYLLGERVSAVDFYLFMLIRWARRLDPDARTREVLGPYYRGLTGHPAVSAMLEAQGIEA